MKPIPRLILFLFPAAALTPLAGAPAALGEYRLSIAAVGDDVSAAVLTADLPEAPPEGARAVVRSAEGREAPAQIERSGKKARVHWLEEEIPRGQARSWTLVLRDGTAPPPALSVESEAEGSRTVKVKGALFTRLVALPEEAKPYLYPIMLDGLRMTRHHPMEELAGEDRDHPHQRSFWFTHGEVNEVDFWSEGKGKGRIVQREVLAAESGPVFARISTRNEWLAADDRKLLDDEREHRFYDLGARGRLIDFTCTLRAAVEEVTFGDTKEGTFGIRVAETMKEKRGGRMVSSRGGSGMKEVWGKPAEWVDFVGPVEGRQVGIAIFDHPASFRHPTHWHARDYGLFAANPFGLKDFTGDRTKDGSHTLKKGEAITFRYRVFLHPGSTEEARVAATYRGFARPPEVKVEPVS